MRLFALLLLLGTRTVFGQSDNYFHWRNQFPTNAEQADIETERCDDIEFTYENGLRIESSGGKNDVSETRLRDQSGYGLKHIYEADIEMRFAFHKGASPGAALGMSFRTYGSSKHMYFRFLVGADGHFYTHLDSADYSVYEKDLRQYTSKTATTKLLVDGSENKLVISRHPYFWRVFINDQTVDSVADDHFFPFNQSDDIAFLFVGDFIIELNSLKEDYALFESKIYDQLKKVKVAEGSGYAIEDLNTESNRVVDANASVTFIVTYGNLEALISSAAVGGVARIGIQRTLDGTYEMDDRPSVIGEYQVTEFTLNPKTRNWYLKAEKKVLGGKTEKSDFFETTRITTTTTTMRLRGNKK